MNAPTTLSALALAAVTPTAAPAQNFDPYNSPPWVWMIELNDHLSEPDYPLWHYTRGSIAGATAMTTLANDAQLVICLPPSTTNADLLAMLGEYLVTFDLIESDNAILELVAPLAAIHFYPCQQGQAL